MGTIVVNGQRNATQHVTNFEPSYILRHVASVAVRRRSVCERCLIDINVLDYNGAVRQRTAT